MVTFKGYRRGAVVTFTACEEGAVVTFTVCIIMLIF